MALKAGRKGLKDVLVDDFGNLKESAVDSFLEDLKEDIEDDMKDWTTWEEITPQAGSSAVSSYGKLYGTYNAKLKMACVRWLGNATAPTTGDYRFDFPSDNYKSSEQIVAPVKDGNYLAIRPEQVFNCIIVSLKTTAYTTAVITYPTV